MSQDIHSDRILILDFGSQYTQLIARRIREIGIYCELHPFDMDAQSIKTFNPKAIILSGGPDSISDKETPKAPLIVFDLNIPVLGICYGMQTMVDQMGGRVSTSNQREFGYTKLDLVEQTSLFEGIQDYVDDSGKIGLDVWMSHGDKVTHLPEGFIVAASTVSCSVAAVACEEKHFYGVQFHPEVTHTKQGLRILERFLVDIAGCEKCWMPGQIIDDAIQRVRAQVGNKQVLLGLSGGVDSSVVAALLHKAIGDQLTCVFVDNGLLRLNEGDQVMAMFAENMGVRVLRVDAEDLFLSKLAGVYDPEEKRKIIGNTFIEVFNQKAKELNGIEFLAQGTIYPDVIESAGGQAAGKAHVIKSHHNVGGLPKNMRMKLVEPLRELFKDEVRKIGRALGLPFDMVYRHPFPGPGLGVRILGEVKKSYANILRQADAIYIEELHKAGWYHKVSQAFAVFLPVKSVGVVGDCRRYEYVIAIRAVETVDFMTAGWAKLPYEVLGEVSNRIMNEIEHVSRVTYDISSKPPATIEWE